MRAKTAELAAVVDGAGAKNTKDAVEYIKKSNAYLQVNQIINLDTNRMMVDLRKDINYQNILKDFNEEFLLKKTNFENNFLNYFRNIKIKNKNLLGKFTKISYAYENKYYDYDYGDMKILYSDDIIIDSK